MRITTNKIEKFIEEHIGEDVIKVVALLENKQFISELELSKKLNIEINKVRNMLYRLDNKSLVFSKKTRDPATGWYLYHWAFNDKRIKDLIKEENNKNIINLQKLLKIEENNIYFICKNGCCRINSKKALEEDYKCDECNEMLEEKDNSDKILKIKKDIEQLI